VNVPPGHCIDVTPQQQQNPPMPNLMLSMITPVHNNIESTLGGMDSCFTA
jgi:hypothetical protein